MTKYFINSCDFVAPLFFPQRSSASHRLWSLHISEPRSQPRQTPADMTAIKLPDHIFLEVTTGREKENQKGTLDFDGAKHPEAAKSRLVCTLWREAGAFRLKLSPQLSRQ